MLWAALATAITVRAALAHLPFRLTWWSFTFPLGTLVTGTTGLALHTGSVVFRWAAFGLYLALVTAWIVVSVRTAAGMGAAPCSARLHRPFPQTDYPNSSGDELIACFEYDHSK